mgnify:CR=1 FL=1
MIYSSLLEARASGSKKLAVLIDPDKTDPGKLPALASLAMQTGVHYFLVGGSLLVNDHLGQCIRTIKDHCDIPVVLFPGNTLQLHADADAILLLSLISGRNAEFLIGKHVVAAPWLRQSALEILPTGYMLIDGGALTSVAYMSNTTPIPAGKKDIAVCTAMAGEMLGLRLLYLEAGSGAPQPVPPELITAVRQAVAIPLIVGGGIRSPEQARAALQAGADMIVVGSLIEDNPGALAGIAEAVHSYQLFR